MGVPSAGAQIARMEAKLDRKLTELYNVADPVIEVNKCPDAHKNLNLFCLRLKPETFMPLHACNVVQACCTAEGPAERRLNGPLEDTVDKARV